MRATSATCIFQPKKVNGGWIDPAIDDDLDQRRAAGLSLSKLCSIDQYSIDFLDAAGTSLGLVCVQARWKPGHRLSSLVVMFEA